MAIETQCPHCKKAYRLKDELAGKRVTCANPDCRKAFTVSGRPSANGAPRPAPAAVDAEAMAAALFKDEPDPVQAAPEDQRKVHMTCPVCDHQWDVPWAMQGKNVLCPECRHRQRVPEQKQGKVDWRDPNAGRPTLAKREELEGVVSAGDARHVSGEALKVAGVIKEEVEPRPLRVYVAFGLAALALVVALAAGILYLRSASKADRRDHYMADALKDMQEAKDVPLPPAEVPLFKAGVLIAAGEFAARKNDDKALQEAIKHFTQARRELEAAPPSPGRDLLFCELAVTQVVLGGDDDQVAAGVRIRWTPGGRQKITEKMYNVQQELQSTLKAMAGDKPVAAEVRFHTVRRLARELARRGQPGVLTESLIAQTFTTEHTEAVAEVALESLRVTGNQEKAKADAQTLTPHLKGAAPPSAQALFQAADAPAPQGVTFAARPGGSEPPSDTARQAFAALDMLQNKQSDAIAVARLPGPPNQTAARLAALALIAEWADNPAEAVQAAQEALPSDRKKVSIPDMTLVRLAAQAGRANQPDRVEAFAKAIEGDGYRAWARAEGLRQLLAASGERPGEESQAEVPTDPKDVRVGHAWGRLALARHNAKVTGNTPDAAPRYEQWGAGTFKPYGLAGLALGLQDRVAR
jgi:hypothetical protein